MKKIFDSSKSDWKSTHKERMVVNMLYETKVIPKIINRLINSELSPEQSARMINEAIKASE
jgi:hypothetical protein